MAFKEILIGSATHRNAARYWPASQPFEEHSGEDMQDESRTRVIRNLVWSKARIFRVDHTLQHRDAGCMLVLRIDDNTSCCVAYPEEK